MTSECAAALRNTDAAYNQAARLLGLKERVAVLRAHDRPYCRQMRGVVASDGVPVVYHAILKSMHSELMRRFDKSTDWLAPFNVSGSCFEEQARPGALLRRRPRRRRPAWPLARPWGGVAGGRGGGASRVRCSPSCRTHSGYQYLSRRAGTRGPVAGWARRKCLRCNYLNENWRRPNTRAWAMAAPPPGPSWCAARPGWLKGTR